MTTPTYSFLPWSRLGLANSISQADNDATVKLRATVPVDVILQVDPVKPVPASQPIHRDIQIYGPGDIVGMDAAAIVRLEPQHWTTSFESNLLAYAEFHDPDFPWRYTPASSTPTRLRPWIAVVALTEDEFDDVKAPGRPLPSFKLKTDKNASDLFPPYDQMWAWAHVHVNESLKGTSLQASLDDDPDLLTSRVLCPRHLEANKTYHAFVIPVFESGRLAGLGQDPAPDLVATTASWAAGQSEFPYYQRWQFRTGFGDFEYLVRLLKPQPANPQVGVRDLDVLHPGAPLPAIANPALDGILELGGALRVPKQTLPDETWDEPYPAPFQQALAAEINTAADYATVGVTAADPDPIVTMPLYGRWHACASRLLANGEPNPRNWVHELNLDPRWRVPAALGTRIIQRHQEKYADAAWQQVGDVLAANALLRLAQLARAAGSALYQKHVVALDESRRMMLTAPVHRRVLLDGVTARTAVDKSTLPYASIAPAFRAIVQSRGRIARRLSLGAPGRTATIVSKLDAGQLVVARDLTTPNAITFGAAQHASAPQLDPATRAQVQQLFSPTMRTAAHVAAMPRSPDFKMTRGSNAPFTIGAIDSAESARFKAALTAAYQMADTPNVVARSAVGVPATSVRVVDALDPLTTVPARYHAAVSIPARIALTQTQAFTPAMVYPEIDQPMYEPLAAQSSELFLPHINLIAHNSVTLLENNQRFIEAYMVGLNHEMARELLWREYPTDQRGSYFRQFWDVGGVFSGDPPPADIREKLRDIPPIDRWSTDSKLGHHDQQVPNPGDPARLVLVIRGEVLKRYPNTVLFALKAAWADDGHGNFDKTKERTLANLDATEEPNPPRSKVRTPMFEARVSPDIYFIGFDITADEALGATDKQAATKDNAGWFFCLQERPGEPRFGVDVPPAADAVEPDPFDSWNALDWSRLGTAEGGVIKIDKSIAPVGDADPADAQAHWNQQTTAAELAYILYQEPVLVAIHAHRMLA